MVMLACSRHIRATCTNDKPIVVVGDARREVRVLRRLPASIGVGQPEDRGDWADLCGPKPNRAYAEMVVRYGCLGQSSAIGQASCGTDDALCSRLISDTVGSVVDARGRGRPGAST